MQLDSGFMTSTKNFLENVGWMRLSHFYSSNNHSKGETVQKVARAVVGLFMILSAYDFMFGFMSKKVKFIVHGSLGVLIACLGLSLLLKKMQKILNRFKNINTIDTKKQKFNLNSEDLDELIFEEESEFSSPQKDFEEEIKPIKRKLLPEFERIAEEEGL